jgi:site-specific DNA-methyltransferase (adenine-specific)
VTISPALYSSASGDWSTPQDFFDALDKEFHFDLDAAASAVNHKCAEYFSESQWDHPNAFSVTNWADYGKSVFCNPPYGRYIGAWFERARWASERGATVVMLAHARTDTRWWHEHVQGIADEVRFIKGRLKFGDGKQSAPFPSAVIIYRPKSKGDIAQ